jgi:hypothetical protein
MLPCHLVQRKPPKNQSLLLLLYLGVDLRALHAAHFQRFAPLFNVISSKLILGLLNWQYAQNRLSSTSGSSTSPAKGMGSISTI